MSEFKQTFAKYVSFIQSLNEQFTLSMYHVFINWASRKWTCAYTDMRSYNVAVLNITITSYIGILLLNVSSIDCN